MVVCWCNVKSPAQEAFRLSRLVSQDALRAWTEDGESLSDRHLPGATALRSVLVIAALPQVCSACSGAPPPRCHLGSIWGTWRLGGAPLHCFLGR